MKTHYTIALSMLAGFGLGAVGVNTLRAQSKPVYTVSEIDVMNVDAYSKEYVSLARDAIKKAGGKLIAVSQAPTSLEGAPQKSRVAINMWESLDKAKAWRESAEYKKAREVGDKYAKFRSYIVDGLTQ